MTDPDASTPARSDAEGQAPPPAGASDKISAASAPHQPAIALANAPVQPTQASSPLDFAALIDATQAPLIRYAMRMLGSGVSRSGAGTDLAAAQDIAQEAYLRLHRHLCEGKRDLGCPEAWLFKVAHNLAIDAIRKRIRQRASQGELREQAAAFADRANADAHDALDSLEQQEVIDVAMGLLDELPDQQRHILTLRLLRGMTLRQIAQVLNSSPGSVNYHLNQGLKRLANQLKQRGLM